MDIFYKKRIFPTALILAVVLIITLIQARISFKRFNKTKSVNAEDSPQDSTQWTDQRSDSCCMVITLNGMHARFKQ